MVNDWYQKNSVPFILNEIDTTSSNCSIENIDRDIEQLQSLNVEVSQSQSNKVSFNPLAMLVNYNYVKYEELSVFLDEGTFGVINIDINVSGKVDLQNNNVVSAQGVAIERNGMNLEELNLGSVSVSVNTPSTGYVTYSCPCSARFAWVSPFSGVKYSGTASDTFTGSFAAYNYY